MDRALDQCIVHIARCRSEPFHPVKDRQAAFRAADRGYRLVIHRLLFAVKSPRYIFVIGFEAEKDLFFLCLRQMIIVHGFVFKDRLDIQLFHHLCGIPGIFIGTVEGLCLGNAECLHRFLQGRPLLSILQGQAVKLLQVVIEKRFGEIIADLIIFQIPLQFENIRRSPGYEDVILAAPFQKVAGGR